MSNTISCSLSAASTELADALFTTSDADVVVSTAPMSTALPFPRHGDEPLRRRWEVPHRHLGDEVRLVGGIAIPPSPRY